MSLGSILWDICRVQNQNRMQYSAASDQVLRSFLTECHFKTWIKFWTYYLTTLNSKINKGGKFHLRHKWVWSHGVHVRKLLAGWSYVTITAQQVGAYVTITARYGYHTGKCIRRFAGIYAYCQYFIDRKW